MAAALLEHGADLGIITKVLDTDSLALLHLHFHTWLVSMWSATTCCHKMCLLEGAGVHLSFAAVPSQLFCMTSLSAAREHHVYFCYFPAAHRNTSAVSYSFPSVHLKQTLSVLCFWP